MTPKSDFRDQLRRLLGGPLTPVTKWLLVIELAVFVVYLVMGSPAFFRDHLALTPRRAIRGLELWQIASALVVHVQGTAVLFNLIGLLVLGPLVERPWGGRRFLSLFVIAGLAANLVAALVGLLYAPGHVSGGCSPSILALVVAFGFIYRRQQLMFFGWVNTRADRLAICLVALSLLLSLLSRDVAGLMAAVAAGGVAALAATARLRADRALDAVVEWWRGRQRARLKRRYQVLAGGKDADAPAGDPPADRKRYLN
jgi:membrane associated rhomboid family serine protease